MSEVESTPTPHGAQEDLPLPTETTSEQQLPEQALIFDKNTTMLNRAKTTIFNHFHTRHGLQKRIAKRGSGGGLSGYYGRGLEVSSEFTRHAMHGAEIAIFVAKNVIDRVI